MRAYFKIFLIFLFLGCTFYVYAQKEISLNETRRELKQKITSKKYANKSKLYLELGKTYLTDSIDLAEKFFNKALSYGNVKALPEIYLNLSKVYIKKQDNKKLDSILDKGIIIADQQQLKGVLAKLYYRKGDAFYYKNLYDKADKYYIKAINKAKEAKNYELVADIVVDRSYIFDFWAKRDEALKMLEYATKISDSIGYIKGKARASLLIGSIYYGLNNNRKALEYYLKTLEAAKKINNKQGVAVSYSNVGMVYIELEKLDLAIQNLTISIKLLKETGDIPGLTNSYGGLAVAYSKKGNTKMALFYADKAIEAIRNKGYNEDLLKVLNAKAEVLTHLKYYETSNKYLDTCIAKAKKIGFGLMLQKSYKSYANNLHQIGLNNKAFEYLQLHNKVKDSILTDKFQKRLADYETKYKTLEKQRKIEKLEYTEKYQKVQLFSVIGLAVILSILLFVFYQKRKKEKLIAKLELDKSQLLTESLSQELKLKNKQLTSHALNMLQKNELLTDFLENLENVIKIAKGDVVKQLNIIKRQVKRLLTSDKDWNTFKIYFEQVNKGFLVKLKEINPKLTTNDIRLATLIRLNMTNKEIASILNINHQSVKNAQYRLKSKLALQKNENLKSFLETL